jgi:hypothetical protein
MDLVYRKVDVGDLALGAFAFLAPFWTIVAWTEGATSLDPLWTYYHNLGIRLICVAAFLTDLAILACVVGRLASIRSQREALSKRFSFTLTLLAFMGATLTWLELWYGSTFYYGAVRDKQGLPFNINHGGPVGSLVFLTFALWRLPPRQFRRVPVLLAKGIATLILLVGHWFIVRLLEGSWEFWQS